MRISYRGASVSLAVLSLVLSSASATATSAAPGSPVRPARVHTMTVAGVTVADTLFGDGPLDPARLVQAVLARNPSLEAARQAWRSAAAAYPQAVALPDPAFSVMVSPGSALDPAGRMIGEAVLSQTFPWPGRRKAAGEQATATAAAAEAGRAGLQRDLARLALERYYDWYDTESALSVNERHRALLLELRGSAESAYATGRGSPQDALQADLERLRLEREALLLQRRRDDLVAGLNELLHRPVSAPLPTPPRTLSLPDEPLPEREAALTTALEARPELQAARQSVRAAEAGLRLARLAYRPDLTGMVGYNSMMVEPAWRPVIGIALQLPVRIGPRDARREQAEAGLGAARSEVERMETRLQLETDRALRAAGEARAALDLYTERLLPGARDLLEAARSGYRTGRNDFSTLIQAERGLLAVEREIESARSAVWRSRAGLEQTLGRIPGLTMKGGH